MSWPLLENGQIFVWTAVLQPCKSMPVYTAHLTNIWICPFCGFGSAAAFIRLFIYSSLICSSAWGPPDREFPKQKSAGRAIQASTQRLVNSCGAASRSRHLCHPAWKWFHRFTWLPLPHWIRRWSCMFSNVYSVNNMNNYSTKNFHVKENYFGSQSAIPRLYLKSEFCLFLKIEFRLFTRKENSASLLKIGFRLFIKNRIQPLFKQE